MRLNDQNAVSASNVSMPVTPAKSIIDIKDPY
jgi:hypothetical protein